MPIWEYLVGKQKQQQIFSWRGSIMIKLLLHVDAVLAHLSRNDKAFVMVFVRRRLSSSVRPIYLHI